MDASQYKDFVLVLLFVKYVSDKYAGDPNALIDVPPGGGFADMVALKGDKEIGDKINKLVGRLADANDSLKGAINVADFNDEEKLGKDKEMDNATSALARMNMVLHDCPTAEIWQGNTLSSPHFKNADGKLKTCDYVVANFPFSNKNWTSGLDPANDLYGRFQYGIPPEKNGDYAFLLHILASLKSTGKGAVIHPHGVLFRGGAEAAIR